MTNPPPPRFFELLQDLGVPLTDAQLARLDEFLNLLHATNQVINLTAVDEPDQAWMRHVLDSLTLIPFLTGADLVADIGSGGGLPGIPLAIVRPGLAFTLMEATGKKARFLETAARELGLSNVQVRADRAEKLARRPEHRERYDIVTGRAVGPLRVFLELAIPLLRIEGRVLAMKGRAAAVEIREAAHALEVLGAEIVEVHHALPEPGEEGVVVEIIKRRRSPDKYPRAPGVPAQKPI